MTRPRQASGGIVSGTAIDPGGAAFLISLSVPALIGIYLLLTSTATLIPGIWLYDAKRILQFGILLVLFLVPALNRDIRGEFHTLLSAVPGWIRLTLLALACWGTLSALVNAQSVMHALNSLSEVALLSAIVLGVFVVAACRRIAGRWFDRIAIALLTLTGLAVGLQELIGVVAAHNAGVGFNFRISVLHFSWPRFYNQVQSWTIPALVALPVLFPRHRLAFFLCAVVLGLEWYVVLMTGARGSFVSLAAAGVFALIFLPPVRSRLLTWQILGFVIGALIFAVVMFSFEKSETAPASEGGTATSQGVAGSETDKRATGANLLTGQSSFFKQSLGKPMAHTSGRIRMWSITVRDARDNPLLGIGPMNYVCSRSEHIGHPHNFPLQIAAEWGILAALTVCALFLYLLRCVSHNIRRSDFGSPEDAAMAGLLLTSVLAGAFHACLSGVMVMPASQVTGMLICGMLLGLHPPAPGQRPVPALRWSFIPGLFLAASLLVLGAHELQTMKSRSAQLTPVDAMWPRIWQDARVCQLYILQN